MASTTAGFSCSSIRELVAWLNNVVEFPNERFNLNLTEEVPALLAVRKIDQGRA
jgi:hypothetical protein